ncbi:MAG: phenylalanine--tRNA ligase subunit alpha [Candidatus Roizmanbacteria bacterium]
MKVNSTSIISDLSKKLEQIASSDNLIKLTTQYLGRKGMINDLMTGMKDIPADEKGPYGKALNDLKKNVQNLIDKKGLQLSSSKKSDSFDSTLPGILPRIGHLHPTTMTIRKINSFFKYLGYSIYTGPEIETEEYNFQKLNLPEDHPARDLQDTLYIFEPEVLLRTHTSSVETRAMTKETPPFRIVVPGKAYRNETTNMTNSAMFYQYEGLVIDKGMSMAHLKGTLSAFVHFLYGKDTKTRFRCKYYPQVEPGAGLDIQCTFCKGSGCQVCKYRGWIEVLGAGMVHPNVLKNCGISPEFNGYAFGMGLDRLVMLKYGISDIRKLYNGELVVR